ncbi:MAG: GlxA family transcriptional regulator [Pseudomonadota bacterium]
MTAGGDDALQVAIVVTPDFNLAATTAFIDPLRAANYLEGRSLFRWSLHAEQPGAVEASNGIAIEAKALAAAPERPDLALVSASWSPECHATPALLAALRRWARFGAVLGGIDTGGFVLAAAGLLSGRRATVHYEHLDAFAELHRDIEATERLFEIDGDRMTAAGGAAAADLALQILRAHHGDALANAAARYVFHESLRPAEARQNPDLAEPIGAAAPAALRRVVRAMEANLEEPVAIPAICAEVGLSQRQMERLFNRHIGKPPQLYYRDIRLDRARGLVTQTEMPLSEVATACGFASQVHFSRVYRERFGMPPSADRVEGRVPFEYRAWPMHRPNRAAARARP